MENYHRRPKATKSKFDSSEDAGSVSVDASKSKISTQEHNQPQQHGVMVISPNGKIRNYVTRGLEILTEVDNDNNGDSISRQESVGPKQTSKDVVEGTAAKIPNIPRQPSTPGSVPGSVPGSSSITLPSKQSTTRGVLTIKAQGRSITKAVTVTEILKRRMKGTLHQFTEIGQITEREIWDPNPDKPKLAPITVTRHRPTIRIRLSKHLDTQTTASSGLTGVDPNMPGVSIPKDEHADDDDDDDDSDDDDSEGEVWPSAILDRNAAARRLVGYQAPTGNDIYS
ncbi:hypothetical protein BGZ65_004699 [Modicella reniformis]|uniref:DNA/RNA-binding protein Alba-like domain-containing protein n=1 Tax=Modicella reniformis TaxID=1440133 RepID=A0A9P6IK50_9FUNG|nr:hypothetical protein BGZ65_004699 [Modicella reniformis]